MQSESTRIFRCFLLSIALCSAPFPVTAQNLTATISGTVTDPSGSSISGAKVTITNKNTGVQAWSGTTDGSGQYVAPQLPVGTYTATAEQTGFKRAEVRDIILSIDQRASVNIVMAVGQISESITVSDKAAARLETDNSSISTLITPSQVTDLPIPNRNITNLLALVGGVAHGGASTNVNTSQLSFNGSRTLNTEATLDGVSVIEAATGQIVVLPSPDALQEFRVLTSGYSAEYGRTSGATISLITKAGTNSFHGAVYELFRNEVLNANNYFNNARLLPRPQDRYNQFGGAIGGPVILPKLYNGKNRTFFFLNSENTIQTSPSTPSQTVPSAAFRSGDFSASPVLVYDPVTRTPFPGNKIPLSRIDPAASKILALVPLQNTTGTADPQNSRFINNYVNPQVLGASYPKNTGRLDHAVNDRFRLYSSLHEWATNQPSAQFFNNALNNNGGDSEHTGYDSSTDYTHIWTPTFITDFRFGYARWREFKDLPSSGINVQQVFGIARSPAPVAPHIAISGYPDLGSNSNSVQHNISNTFEFAGSATKVLAAHTIKFGAQLRKNQFNNFNPGGNFYGVYSFNGELTNSNLSGGNAVNGLADFLLGQIKTAQYDIPQPETGRRNFNAGVFVQDDWKVNSKLTVNAGVRWEYESPLRNVNNIYSRVDAVTGQLLVAGKNASETLNLETGKLNFGPRIGFAYSATPRTVIRSAFGIFYSQVMSNLGGSVTFPGFAVQQNFTNAGTGIAQPFSLSQGVPLIAVQDLANPLNLLKAVSITNPLSPGAQFTDISHLPSVLQWNFGVQQDLGKGVIFDANYLGNHGTHLPISLTGNLPDFNQANQIAFAGNTAATQMARPFPTVGGIGGINDAASSSYHALQLRGRRQFSSSFAFQATYTWAKAIDDASGIYNFSQPNGLVSGQFPSLFRSIDRSVSSFDLPQSFSVALQYTTRGPWWLRNIQVSPIFIGQKGLPQNISQSNLFPGISSQRPNVIGASGKVQLPEAYANGTGIQYLIPAADPNFPLAPSGPLFVGSGATRTQVLPAGIGNLGRYTVREPGEINLDLSVSRRFSIGEHARLQLRADAFNSLNHTNLGPPSTSLSVTTNAAGRPVFNSSGFGLITSAASARFLQLVARIEF